MRYLRTFGIRLVRDTGSFPRNFLARDSVSRYSYDFDDASRDPADQVGFGHFLFQLRQHLEHPVTNQVAIGPNLYYQPGSWYDLEWFSFTVSTSAGSAESLRTGCCTVAGTGSMTQAIGANRRGERSDARPTSEKIMRDVDGEGDAQGAA